MQQGSQPHTRANTRRRGQALAEFVILIVVLTTLIVGVTTIATICHQRIKIQQDARFEAGTSALYRSTKGWVSEEDFPDIRASVEHRINALARLEDYEPALNSKLPMSNYTLASREVPDGDLGLSSQRIEKIISLDSAFIQLIYNKKNVKISTEVTFPAVGGIWQ